MDCKRFYSDLFAPLEADLGPIDTITICAIIGFDGGGPMSFCTIGANQGGPFITYVSCELAVRKEQVPSNLGRYELICSCDDEQWVRSILSELGRMSLVTRFDNGHTVDIGPLAGPHAAIQGVLFQTESCSTINGESYAIFRVIGITRQEMEYCLDEGPEGLVAALRVATVYPHTSIRRATTP